MSRKAPNPEPPEGKRPPPPPGPPPVVDSVVMNKRPHTYLKHTGCHVENCVICDGDIHYCTVCEGADASLSTHCIGRPLTDNEEICLTQGGDFKNDKWEKPL